ncbi:MAG: peptidylprolyl isomerase [Saprospiraceae bacterium]|nr:peptidylprolyl isomerase [Saprospiraceae bacterium]
MALIGTIRKNSWLLVVAIGLALAAFVIMDMTGQSGPTAGSLTLVEVDGKKVDYTQFQNAERILYTGSTVDVFSRRNYLYNYFVDKAIVEDEAEDNGLGVPLPELMDRQFGINLSPLVQQRFANPTTGQVDRAQLNSIKQAIDNGTLTPSLRELWAHQENEVIAERLTEKLTNLVGKAFYTPTWLVEQTNLDQARRTDFTFVAIPYDQVPNNDVSVSESNLKKYLSDHAGDYEQEAETRSLDFVSFDVMPTVADSSKLRDDLANLIEEFKVTDNDTLFVDNNYGSLDFAFVKKELISPIIADSVFALPVGSIVGPYMDGGAYRAAKIRGRITVPDSVHVRHILRRAQTLEEYQAAQKTVDSLKTLIESGEQIFDSLAVNFSQGAVSVTLNGGDLGYYALGGFVKPFNDLVFYEAELNTVYPVITEFGVHLVEVLDRKYINREEGVQLAYLNFPIVPSQETQDSLYELSLSFVGSHRNIESLRGAVLENPNLNLQSSAPFEINDFTVSSLGSGQTSRDIIRWVFDPSTEVGDVSPEVFIYQDQALYFNNKYVIAAVKQIAPAGVARLDDVRPAIEGLVRNELKAALLKGELAGKDLETVAQQYDITIDSAKGVSFVTDFISGLGEEPAVAAQAYEVPLNEVSAPIEGTRAVYLIKPYNRTEPGEANVASLRSSYTGQIASQAKAGLMQSLRKQVKIEDNRYLYY